MYALYIQMQIHVLLIIELGCFLFLGSAKREQENRKDHTFKFGHSMGGIGFILDLFGNIFTHIFGGNDNYVSMD